MRPSFGTNITQTVTHIWQKAFSKHALGIFYDTISFIIKYYAAFCNYVSRDCLKCFNTMNEL